MACEEPSVVLPIKPSTSEEDSLDVISRYKKLMKASLDDDSVYERSKKTIFELSKELNLTESERANIVAGQITQMTMSIESAAMSVALQWAKEDATVGYSTAILKENASKANAEAKLMASKVCTEDKNANLVCAKIESEIASSIRNNGRVDLYDKDDECKPIKLKDEGLRYEQTEQVEASTYQILADAYRKSGVVKIGIENGMTKGIDGDRDGYTHAQTMVAERQYVGFEDSKRNHAVNASSQTIGQLIAAEAPLDDRIVKNYNKGMEYLLSDSVPIVPGGSAAIDGIQIEWQDGITDTVVDDGSGILGDMTVQLQEEWVTVGARVDNTKNIRNGDYIIASVNGGQHYVRHIVTIDNVANNDLVTLQFPSVKFSSSGSDTEYYDIEMYVQDMAGNKSDVDTYQLRVKYNPIAV